MLYPPLYIRDVFRQPYVICFSVHKRQFQTRSPLSLKASDINQKFKLSSEFWRNLLAKHGSTSHIYTLNDQEVLKKIIYLLERQVLQIFSVPNKAIDPGTAFQRVFRHTKSHQNYQFSFLPLRSNSALYRPKDFQDSNAARIFFEEIKLSSNDMTNLCNQFEINVPTGKSAVNLDAAKNALSDALVNGDVIVSLKPVRGGNNRTEKEIQNKEVEKKSIPASYRSIAPNTTTANLADKNPLCQRNSLVISCSHGKSVTLDSSVKHMPTLEIVASSQKTKKPDRITLTSHISDICDNHKHGHIAISDDQVTASVLEAGKTSTFDAYSEDLKIRNNPVKYAWLPGIKPKTYTIYPGHTCDDSQLDNAGRGIVLKVYPKVAWDWKVNIGYGKDIHTLEENEKNKGQYQKALQSKRFGITGHIKLTQDNTETFELSTEFKEAIDSTVSQIDAITGLVDKVVGQFDQGKKPKVTITWPNLSLNLKTELAEGVDNYRTVAFDFGISAAPFLGLSVEVDILPVIAKPLDGGVISKWLIEEAQASLEKGIGNKNGLAHLQGSVKVIMTGSGSLGFETHFKGDFSNNSNKITKVTGKPASGKIEFSAEGKVELKGHLLQVKVELVAGVGIKSGITLGMLIDEDDKGYYWKPDVKFNGLRVYITKYVKSDMNIGKMDGKSARKRKVSVLEKNVKEHIWISEKTLNTEQHYFIKY